MWHYKYYQNIQVTALIKITPKILFVCKGDITQKNYQFIEIEKNKLKKIRHCTSMQAWIDKN